MANQRILAVDDEEHILELIEYNLVKNGFSVTTVSSGEEALALLEKEPFDLVLLDIMMEGMGGIEVLKRIRNQKETKDMPVILLTARGEEIDKVLGLEMGADDYMAKPFGVHELAARIKAVLRRSQRTTAEEEREHKDSVHAGRLTIDKETREAMVDGKPLDLALKEFELLYLLVKNKGFVFSRDQALEQVWGYDYFGETRTVDVHIRNIRKKLEEKGMNPDCIKTVRGVGYKFQQEES
ncbi:MAG: response regulator transcription factor [Lachnospiraceae bacterium]|nr:response regulator transcription factor [Lachnospiraceae bacterium]